MISCRHGCLRVEAPFNTALSKVLHNGSSSEHVLVTWLLCRIGNTTEKKHTVQTASGIPSPPKKMHVLSPVSAFVFYKNRLLLWEHSRSAHNQRRHARGQSETPGDAHKRRDRKEIRPENVTSTFPRTTCGMTECRFDAGLSLQYAYTFQPLLSDHSKYSDTPNARSLVRCMRVKAKHRAMFVHDFVHGSIKRTHTQKKPQIYMRQLWTSASAFGNPLFTRGCTLRAKYIRQGNNVW